MLNFIASKTDCAQNICIFKEVCFAPHMLIIPFAIFYDTWYSNFNNKIL